MNIREGVAEFLRWRKGGDGERRCWEVRGQRNKKACRMVKGGGIVKSNGMVKGDGAVQGQHTR